MRQNTPTSRKTNAAPMSGILTFFVLVCLACGNPIPPQTSPNIIPSTQEQIVLKAALGVHADAMIEMLSAPSGQSDPLNVEPEGHPANVDGLHVVYLQIVWGRVNYPGTAPFTLSEVVPANPDREVSNGNDGSAPGKSTSEESADETPAAENSTPKRAGSKSSPLSIGPNVTQWHATVEVDGAELRLVRKIRAELSDSINECENGQCIVVDSKILTGVDGMLLAVTYDPNLSADRQVRIHFDDPAFDLKIPLHRVHEFNDMVTVDPQGNQVAVRSFSRQPALCPHGFTDGQWLTTGDQSGEIHGRWRGPNGHTLGKIVGLWGTPTDAPNSILGIYTDSDNKLRGIVRGSYVVRNVAATKSSELTTAGVLSARVFNFQGHVIAHIRGRFGRIGNEPGHFGARWRWVCNSERACNVCSDGVKCKDLPYSPDIHSSGVVATCFSTEIVGVCNQGLCETIAPDQERAHLPIFGETSLILNTTNLPNSLGTTLSYGAAPQEHVLDVEFDKLFSDGGTLLAAHFNTNELPLGPNTWATYSVVAHPSQASIQNQIMGATLSILTHGAE
jgi:hypothetical protein